MKYRTIWLSDIHLGTRGCQADKLLSFLKDNDSEYLILVGDIIDFWAMKRGIYWPEEHNTIIQKILKKSRHGTKVIFIPGNHDEVLRQYVNINLGNIFIEEEYIHKLEDGREIYCLHGDRFDVITKYHKWIAILGDIGYEFLLWTNRIYNNYRRWAGKDYWSLSAYIKGRVKEAVSFISEYEESIIHEAKKLEVYGVLCGHIHHAEIKEKDGIIYMNTGDTVESCTSIVEDLDGNLILLSFLHGEVEELTRI